MKHTNTNEFNDKVKAYLIPIIESKAQDYGDDPAKQPFTFILDTARSEVPHEFARHGEQGGLEYWLSGLGLGIDYLNCEIVRIAEEWHECELTEKQADMVIDRWFSFLALKILRYSRHEG